MAHVFKFDGTVTPVKNLGWLLKHSGEARAIAVRSNGLNDNEASLIVTGDGWVFYSPFASVDVLRRWIHRPSLAGVPVTDDMSHATTLPGSPERVRLQSSGRHPADSGPADVPVPRLWGDVVTGSEMAQYIGRTGGYRPSRDLNFEVRVVDVRMRYGTLDVQIAPVAGNGTQWVSALNVTLDY